MYGPKLSLNLEKKTQIMCCFEADHPTLSYILKSTMQKFLFKVTATMFRGIGSFFFFFFNS